VNQVLEIARLEGRGLELDSRPEGLEGALEDAIAGLQGDLEPRGLHTRIVCEGPLPTVIADPWGLRSVLSNLLQNAAFFSPDGGEIRIRVEPGLRTVDIAIEDDGEGVDPADLPRLMQPFEQGENALTRRAEGAGLGLPICELTCRAMGGRLQLIAKPGKGLTARIRLQAG
jgi:signal transduction histidine kinase